MRMRWLIVPAILAFLAGCDALEPPPEPNSTVERSPLAPPTRNGLETPRATARARAPSRWLKVSWPEPLRLIESGVAGPTSRPILWYRFGLDGQAPGDAVALALDALEELSGDASLRSMQPDPDSGRVVGQLRGSRFAASVVAEDSTSSRDLRVTVELLDAP